MFRLVEISGEELRAYRDAKHPEANLLQSPAWGAAQPGAKAFHLGIVKVRGDAPNGAPGDASSSDAPGNAAAGDTSGGNTDEQLVGATLAILRPARRGRYLEVPGGPLIDWQHQPLVNFTLAALRRFASQHGCVFVRLRPQVEDSPAIRQVLRHAGARPASFHLNAEHTNILQLTPSEDTLLSKMRRQTRYEIRQALKQDLQVDYATDQAAFEQFYRVQQQTAARQHFLAPSLRELLAIHEAFGEDARIYRAYAPGSNRTPGGQQPLAYGLVVISGREADYLEAASEPAARGVPTAYALQWRIIRDLKSAGIERYNLWGIAYSSDPRHRYAQVTTFKNGFGGNKVTYVSAHDLVIKPPRYAPVWVLETLRRRLRRL